MTGINPLNQHLGIRKQIAIGDTIEIDFPLIQDGASYTPTLSAAEFNIKTNLSDADSAAIISKTLGSGIALSGSTITVTITPANQSSITTTGTYYWALRIEESSGDVTTVAAGTITLTRTAVLAI